MNDKDKYRAKIEAELVKFGKSIEELEQEAERQQDKFDADKRAHIEDIKKQKAHAEARLQEMDQAEEEKRPGILSEFHLCSSRYTTTANAQGNLLMRELLELICSELSAGRAVASAVITDSSGSTPRSAGSRMAVSADGKSRGTVGGGPGEAMAQQEAKNALRTQTGKLLKLDLTGKDVADSGMICGGRLAVLVEYIAPSPENIRLFEDLRAGWEAGEGRMLCTVFREKDGGVQILSRSAAPGRLPTDLPAELHDKVQTRAAKARLPFTESQNGCTILVEPIRSRGRLIVAGAGHVGQATAQMAALSGFHTVVMDDRPDFLVPEHYPPACRLRQIAGFADCFKGLSIGPDSLIVIVTRGHVHDQTVLAQALATDAGYVGMIGSRKKRNAIYQNLLDQGISPAAIDRVHCPIGLDIGADTPEEIAVSIVAELIQKRAENA